MASAGQGRPARHSASAQARPLPLAAGQSGSLMTWRFDRFGNRITSAAQEVPFLATAFGPGTLRSQIIEKGDGSLEIRYKAAVFFTSFLECNTAYHL